MGIVFGIINEWSTNFYSIVYRIWLGKAEERKRKWGEISVEVKETNGEFVIWGANNWSLFDTFSDIKLAASKEWNRDMTNWHLWRYDGHRDVILELDCEFNCNNNCYHLVENMNEFELKDEIKLGLFECRNTLTNEVNFAWRISPLFLDRFPRSILISEVISVMDIVHDNVMKIHDLRSDGRRLFVITDKIDGDLFDVNYDNIKSVSEMKFCCCQILQGIKELIKNKKRMSVKIWLCKNLRCLLIPFSYSFSFDIDSEDCEYQLERIYADNLVKILGPHKFSTDLDAFVSEFIDKIKQSEESSNKHIIDDLIKSKYLRSDATVHFTNSHTNCMIPDFTITYFSSPLKANKLRQNIADYIGKNKEDIIILMDKDILKYNDDKESNIDLQDNISIKYFVVKENKLIKSNYDKDCGIFKGFDDFQFVVEGGFSKIYKYKSPENEKKLAIKFFQHIMSHYQAEKVIAVLNEVSILTEMTGHLHIVSFLEFNRVGYDSLMIIMEHLEGGSLNDYIKSKKRLPDTEVKFFLKQILSGLNHLHSHGIIHLDIKCDNVLINGEYTICKLTDFGLSRKLKAGMNFAIESVTSTVEFLSPKLLTGCPRKYDCKTDIWSLGGAIVEMTTGRPPFSGVCFNQIPLSISEDKQIKYDNSGVSSDMIKLIDISTKKDPDDRPSAQDLLYHDLLKS